MLSIFQSELVAANLINNGSPGIVLQRWLGGAVYKPEDFVAGKNMGRIYRVVSANAKTVVPKLAGAGVKELCAALGDANGWTRDTARRLLLERADPSRRSIGSIVSSRGRVA